MLFKILLFIIMIILLVITRLLDCIHQVKNEYISRNMYIEKLDNMLGTKHDDSYIYNLSEITKSQWIMLGFKRMFEGNHYDRCYK